MSGFGFGFGKYMGIVLNCCQYGVLYLGSHYNTGPYLNFPHFGNSNLGKLPYAHTIGGRWAFQAEEDGHNKGL